MTDMAEWFRSWHGAPTDQKLALVASKADVPRAVAVAVWWALLDIASQAEDRGSIAGADPELIAFSLDIPEEQVRALLPAFDHRKMTGAGRICNWDKRQPRKEDPTAADRKRAQRERDRNKSDDDDAPSRDVTLRHAPSRDVTTEQNRAEQNRAEQNRAEPAPPAADWKAVGRTACDMLEKHEWTYGIVRQWIADGCDPEADIYPAIREAMDDGRAAKARGLTYFTPAVTQKRDERKRRAAAEGVAGPRPIWAEGVSVASRNRDDSVARSILDAANNGDLAQAERIASEYLAKHRNGRAA